MKTIFFGASSYVIPVIAYLQKNFDLALVITTESRPTDAVPAFCQQNTIPFLTVSKLDEETVEKIKKLNTPFAVLADFRLLIKQDVIDLFPKGIINIHPSLLPEYRGPTPGTTAILEGKTTTGASLMLLDKDLDHGPILGQMEEKIEPTDTSVTLYTRLFAKGVELLQENLETYLQGKLEPKEQDHSKATYTKFLTRESGYIDLEKSVISNETKDISDKISRQARNDNVSIITPKEFDCMVRAYFPWPGVWTLLRLPASEGQARKEIRVKFLPNPSPVIPDLIGNPGKTTDSRLRENDIKNNIFIQMEGKKPVTMKDFVNGYPEAKEFLEKLGILR